MDKTDAKTTMEELTMVLIYLSHFTERDRFANQDDKYAWKGYNFDVLNKLDEKDYIRQGFHRSKSMYITKDGEAKAKELMGKYGIEDWQYDKGGFGGVRCSIYLNLTNTKKTIEGKSRKPKAACRIPYGVPILHLPIVMAE